VNTLLEQKNFFKAKSLKASLPVMYQDYVDAVLDNAFNKPVASNQKIAKVLKEYTSLPDHLRLKLFRLQEDNATKVYDYKTAKRAAAATLKTFSQQLTEEEKDDISNNLKIWTALEKVPAQRVIINGNTRLKMGKDKAGLSTLPVIHGTDSLQFIFDTGANMSTITRSVAKQLKMQILPADITVGAITGKNVKADLAVCEQLKLGNIVIEHAVFLVMNDEELAFPQINYQIYGILGFPVIEAFKEVQLTQDGYFMVPEQETALNMAPNMAIDGLYPLLYVDGMNFSFDTGATETILYAAYFKAHQQEIEAAYKSGKISLGGAGGGVVHDGYKIQHTFTIMEKQVRLDSVNLLIDNIGKEQVYGNIGQDVIRQFNKMTLNFDQMFIKFD
jgi:hypothetical protein